MSPNPSLTLGVDGFTPFEMASAFGTYAGEGQHVDAHLVVRIENADGRVLWEPELTEEQAVDVNDARVVTDALRRVVEGGTGQAAQIGRPAAGKTGTTNDSKDAWFVGYVPQLATAAWVGYPNETRAMTDVRGIRVTGGSFPAAIWGRFMRSATENLPVLAWEEPTTTVPWTSLGEGAGEGDGDD
jgi:penicillin-binding protein 1A